MHTPEEAREQSEDRGPQDAQALGGPVPGVLALQASVGNRAVGRLLGAHPAAVPPPPEFGNRRVAQLMRGQAAARRLARQPTGTRVLARSCRTDVTVGSANSAPEDTSRWPSGAYSIWGPPFSGEDSEPYALPTVRAWIDWRFGHGVSGPVRARIEAEIAGTTWTWTSGPPDAGCQGVVQISMAHMQRLVAMVTRDRPARSAESREHGAGMPTLPAPEPVAEEIVVTGHPDGTSTSETHTAREVAERLLDPQSVYEGGVDGTANFPPYPARLEGPESEVPSGIGTFRMNLDIAATTSDPLLQMARYMNAVTYHWEVYNITNLIRAGLGREATAEARRWAGNADAAAAASGATGQRARNEAQQLSEETIRSWQGLRDPIRAAEGGSAVDVVTRAWANYLNLTLLPASAIIAAGGQALGGLADLLGAYSQEREISFPASEGFYMVRCIAQPSPRGPNGSERRAASVATRIVEVRAPATLASNVLDAPEAAIAELQAMYEMSNVIEDRTQIEVRIAMIRRQADGDVVDYLTDLLAAKQREVDAATPWQRTGLARERDQLQLRLEQARRHRVGTTGTHHRPRAAFVSTVTGETYPMVLELSELPVESGARVRLLDLTASDREPVERSGSTLEEAVRRAFNELALHDNLGPGRLVVRMPSTYQGQPRELSLQTGDADVAIVRRRLADLATTLMILSIVVPGVGEVSAVIAAGLAVERLARRAANHTLRLDVESVSDTLAIVGAVAQGAQLVGRMRVVRAGRGFIATVREGEETAIRAAAQSLDEAIRAQRVLDATSMVANVGGLVWGDLVALDELARIQQEELDGRISHSVARRRRASLLGAAIRDHGIMLGGMLRPHDAGHASGRETGDIYGRLEGDPPVREPELIPESDLERRATESESARQQPTPEPQRTDGVRMQFNTPDNLHEIFVLNDGRIFRCSLTCAQLRTWYDPYLKSQTDTTRSQEATRLSEDLAALETRTKAGENTPELRRAIGRLDVQMREFVAPDLATELEGTFRSRTGAGGSPLLAPGQHLLTLQQTRNLLRFFGIDEIHLLAGANGFDSPDGIRRFADRPDTVLRAFRRVLRAFPGDNAALRGLAESAGTAAYPESVLVAAYERAVSLKETHGTAITGDIIAMAVRAERFLAGPTRPPIVTPGINDARTAGRGGIRVISESVNRMNQTETTIEGYLQQAIANRAVNAPNYNEEALWAALREAHPEMAGWQAAHLWGPGFGDEAAAGILLAPRDVNLRLQNGLVEGFLRNQVRPLAAAAGLPVFVRARATSHPRNQFGGVAMAHVQYEFFVERANGTRDLIGRYEFSVDAPPSGRIHDVVIEGPDPVNR